MRQRFFVVAALAGCLLLLSVPAAIAGGGGGPCAGFSDGPEVVLRDMCLDGTAQFAPAGQDLRVVNEGQMPHDFVAVGGEFASDTLDPGASADIAGPDPGVYRVYCTLHGSAGGDGMAGVLIVGDTATAAGADLVQTAALPVADTAPAAHQATWWALGGAAFAVALALASLTVAVRRRPAASTVPADG